MNARKILLVLLSILSLAGMAASPPAGTSPAGGWVQSTQSGEFPRLLKVPPLRQLRYTSCGEAAITMAFNYANPESPTTEQEVIDFASQAGYYTERRWPFTSPENMVRIARYYGDEIRTGTVTTQEEGLALLIEQLSEGEPVIIDVPVRLYEVDSVAHFILVTGISRDPDRGNAIMIHYNDPLSGDQRVSRWDGNEGVWNGWKYNEDPGGSGWWLVIPPP